MYLLAYMNRYVNNNNNNNNNNDIYTAHFSKRLNSMTAIS